MFYVYLLQSKKTDKFYIGSSSNVRDRLNQHNSGIVQSTKAGIPWELVYFEAFKSKKDGLIREKKLKAHGQSLRHLKERIKNSIN